MKNKTKLVLGLAALTAVTAGVATTSTLAWFTTTRNATVSFTGAGIYSNNGNLQMKYVKVDKSTTTESSSDYVSTVSIAGVTDKGVTDISMDASSTAGAKFYQPKWNPTTIAETDGDSSEYKGFVATSIEAVTNTDTVISFVHFQIILSNTGTNVLNTYLSSGTGITATGTTAQTTAALKAARVAIYNGTTLLSYFGSATADSTLNYVKSDTGAKLYGAENFSLGTLSTTGTAAHIGAFGAVTTGATDQVTTYNTLKPITKGTDVTLDVYSWIEGTSAGAVSDALSGVVKFNLDIVAFNA
jgi:hypothetical protein